VTLPSNEARGDPPRLDELRCATTGIGSLPHADAHEAVGAVLARHPEVPYWPQLPRRSPREGMLGQFFSGFPFLQYRVPSPRLSLEGDSPTLREAIDAVVAAADRGDETPLVRQDAEGWYAFLEAVEGRNAPDRPRWIKGQITGPVTAASLLIDVRGRPLLAFPGLLEGIARYLEGIARAQIRTIRRLGATPLLFVDEPILHRLGAAEGGEHETIRDSLNRFLDRLGGEGAIRGVHCCGTVPWDLFLSLDTELVSFDVALGLDDLLSRPDGLEAWTESGRGFAFGAVPTSRFDAAFDPAAAARTIGDRLGTLVGNRLPALLSRSLVTPACGTMTLSREKDDAIAAAAASVSRHLRRTLDEGVRGPA
jgi:hypothetical protein